MATKLKHRYFENEVPHFDGKVIVDSWAPSGALPASPSPRLDRIADGYQVKLVKVNIDEQLHASGAKP